MTSFRYLLLSISLVVSAALQAEVPDSLWLNDVTVTARQGRFGVHSPQTSAMTLSGAEIKTMPTVFGEPDILKTLQTTPGVQSGKSGNAGIMVRGGNFDQNHLLIDGASLYSTEHLKGFVTAFNPDMVSSLSFYRGAFPARYSGRLSSVIDITAGEGDFYNYHADATVGLSMGRVSASGPIIKGKTSFAVAARMSYFGLIYRDIVDRHYDKIGVDCPYSDLSFWDVNAKIAHLFSKSDKLTLTFVKDRDSQKTPRRKESEVKVYEHFTIEPDNNSDNNSYNFNEPPAVVNPNDTACQWTGTTWMTNRSQVGAASYNWGNTLAALNWEHRWPDNKKTLLTTLAYSAYRYRQEAASTSYSDKYLEYSERAPQWMHDSIVNWRSSDDYAAFKSDIASLRLASNFDFAVGRHNRLAVGAEVKGTVYNPRRHIISHVEDYQNWCLIDKKGVMTIDHRDEYSNWDVNALIGNKLRALAASAYVSDNLDYRNLHIQAGFNLTAYAVKNKTYLSPEPRLSLAWEFMKHASVKGSFGMASQSERLLSTSSIASPSDIWVPLTDSVPPMKSKQISLAFNYEFPHGIDLAVEGYYKQSTGNVDYVEGTDFSCIANNWEKQITIGKARAYGVEFMLRKWQGNFSGWVSYTWSRAFNKFDTPGAVIAGGREFPSLADRPHNLAVNISYSWPIKSHPANHFDISALFRYATGRRITIADHISYSGMLAMADHYSKQHEMYDDYDSHLEFSTSEFGTFTVPVETFDIYMRFEGYDKRQNYQLPAESSLDVSASFTLKHHFGQSRFTLGVTNLLNHKNISSVFLAKKWYGLAYLKGICDFPIMPVFSYSFSF